VANVKSFDEFLERRVPGSRRKAYYLISIHENLPPEILALDPRSEVQNTIRGMNSSDCWSFNKTVE
jgi:hypothetical protein